MLNVESYLSEREKPQARPIMSQQWSHLTFAHVWIDPEIVQALLPPGLEVDTWEGETFLGFVPFVMRGVRPSPFPRALSYPNFFETNVRTYVHHKGRPGVWFFSLDASDLLGCKVARSRFALPYFHANMTANLGPSEWTYEGRLTGAKMPAVWDRLDAERGEGRYTVKCDLQHFGEETLANPGTLEFFLAERYTLFSCDRHGKLYSGRVWHEPYKVRMATDPEEAIVADTPTLLSSMAPKTFRDALSTSKWDHGMVCEGVDVRVWPIRAV